MNFIIFDLEWNNAYNYKLKRGMNEIIEIGAVKLDENLDVVDTFKQLIKPQLSRKLGSRFKNLTHIVYYLFWYSDCQKIFWSKQIRQLGRTVTGYFAYIEDLIERENVFTMEEYTDERVLLEM